MSSHPPPQRPIKEPSYLDAIVPLVVLIALIAGSVYLFGLGAIEARIAATKPVACSR